MYMSYCSYCRINRMYARKVCTQFLPIELAEIVSDYLICDIILENVIQHYARH